MLPADIVASNTTPHPVKAISAGWDICAIREDGTLGCWGGGHERPPAGTFVSLDNGDGSACAVRTNGRLACWGDIGRTVPRGRFQSVSVSESQACAIRRAGTLVCWYLSSDDEGAVVGIEDLPHPQGTYTYASASGLCAIRSTGGLECWDEESGTPRSVSESETYVALDYPCAVRTGGELDCFGIESGAGSPKPMGDGFVDVSAYGDRICAIRTDGTLACWGGEGWDRETDADLPMRVPPGRYVAVTVGEVAACATRADGRAVCWGENDEVARPAPTIVLRAPGWTDRLSIPLRWSAIPWLSRVVSYDVERVDEWDDEGFEAIATTPILESTTRRGITVRAEPGGLRCWRARARDADGIVSPWSDACTALPDDDGVFTRSAGWGTVRGSGYYLGRASRATKKGATLSMTVDDTFSIGIMATSCPSCGAIRILVDGESQGTVSLRSSGTVHRKMLWLGDNAQDGFHGQIVLEVASRGRPVIVDGIVLDFCPEGVCG